MKKFNLLMSFMMIFIISAYSQYQLNTVPPLNGGNGSAGITFNLTAHETIIVDSLFASFDSGGNTEIWYNPNPISGQPTVDAANGWIQLSSPTVTQGPYGDGTIAPIDYNLGLMIPKGSTYGFYIDGGGGAPLNYTTGTTGVSAPFTDGNITIETGDLVGYGGSAPNPTNHPRQFNGGVKYTIIGGANDAAVLSVDSPTVFCSGSQNISATIGNFGSNQIDSVDVHWEIDGVPQPTIQYIGLLDTIGGSNPNTAQINLGSYTFPSGLTEIKVYTSNPNGVADTNNLNDTLRVQMGPSLSGTYTIDQSSPTAGTNFNSFSDLSLALNTFGVCGPTVVNVAPGTYVDQFSLYDIKGSSATNTILINGQNSSQATLSHDQTIRNSTITLVKVKYIEIKNLTIEATATSDAWGIHITDSSHNISIDSNIIMTPIGANTDVAGVMISASEISDNSAGTNGNYISITNNEVIGGERGISAYGSSSPLNRGLLIESNTIHSADEYGIYIFYYDSVAVRGNTVNNLLSTTSDALYMSDTENFEVSGNYLNGQDNGMDADDLNFNNPVTTNSMIFNNMFIGDDDGAYFDDSESITFYHNSFRGGDYGIYANDHLNWVVINNIFYGNTNYAFYTPDNLSMTMDYNVFYTGGTDLIRFGGTTEIYADLTAFQTAEPTMNANSLEGDPGFATANDLHLVGTLANNVGDNSVGIPIDFDGDPRPLSPSTIVDIGADEFNPPTCPNVSALTTTGVGTSSVSISWTAGSSETEWQIEYDTIGFTQGTGNYSTVNTSPNTTISGLTPASGYDFYVRAVCAVGDSSQWSFIPLTAFTLCTKDTLPFVDDFNSGTLSSCWTISDPANVSIEASCDNRNNVIDINYEEEAITPVIKASAAQSIEVSYYIGAGACINDPEDTEHFYVEYWDGTQWVIAKDYDGSMPQAFVWETFFIPPGSYNDSLMVKFNMIDGTTDAWQIDSVVIKEGPSCLPPTSLLASALTSNSADLSWTESMSATEWEIEYGPLGFTQGNGNYVITSSDSTTVSGLSIATDYDYYVRAICGPNDTSTWSGPLSFTTTCGIFPAPFMETFSGSTIPNCWTQSATSGGPWIFGGTTNPDFGNNYEMPDHTNGNDNEYTWVDQSATDVGVILETPEIDISTLTSPAVDFWIVSHNNTSSVNTYNILYVEAFDGTNYQTIDSIQGDFGLQWVNFVYDLSSYIYNTNLVKVRFRVESGGDGNDFDNDILLDDVAVLNGPTCYDPTNLSSTSTSSSSVDISWNSSASNTIVEYGAAGFTLGAGTQIVSTTNSESITGLTPNLAYEAYVRDSCGPGDVSNWVGPITFGSMAPCDDFDIYSTGDADSQSVLINSWAGAAEDAEISTDYASSGPNSLKIHDSGANSTSDVVAELEDYSSGTWNMAIDVYIPATYGGYYNILHNYSGSGTNVWAIEVTLDANGTATIEEGTNGSATIGTFNYNPGAWNTIEHIIDLDNDTAFIIVNGVNTGIGWQFSLGSTNFGDQFNAMNFYSTAPTGQTPLSYFDNFCLTPYVIILPYYSVGTINTVDANGVADSLNVPAWTSGTVAGVDIDGTAGLSFTIIDQSGSTVEGINVNSIFGTSNYVVNEGDSILLRGRVGQSNGLQQFIPDSISIISTGHTLPPHVLTSTLNESTESQLIRMEDLVVTNVGGGSSFEVTLSDGTNNFLMFVDQDTDVDNHTFTVGDNICYVNGIGGQFDNSSPYTSGYEIVPMRASDVAFTPTVDLGPDTIVCDTAMFMLDAGSGFATYSWNVGGSSQMIQPTSNDIMYIVTVTDSMGCTAVDSISVTVDICTGLDKNHNTASFAITPNPSKGMFSISANGLNKGETSITVRDISGKVIYSETVNVSSNNFKSQINLEGQAKGIYFISVTNKDQVIHNKVVIQ